MRNVKSLLKLGTLGLIFFLASCKSPDVEVSSINKKLPAPQLKSGTQSPFDQDLEVQTYVRVQGTCDSRVGDLNVSFNNILWAKPPSIPTYANTTLAGTEVNDFNCSDGKFDFYLTATDILATWGVQTGTAGTSGDDVNAIYIKGETLIGETFTLVLKNNKNDSDHGGGPATTVAVEKMSPAGFGGSGQCELFYLYVKNANGYNTTHTSDVTATLTKSVDGGSYATAEVYKSMSDCDAGNQASNNVTIPAANGMMSFYVKLPTDTGSLNKGFSLKIASTTALTPSATASTFTVRDSASTSYRYVTVQSPNWRLYKDVCTAFTANINKYGQGQSYSDDFATELTMATDNSSAKLYSDSSCTTRATALTIPAYTGATTFYVKYTKSASDTIDFPSFKFSITATAPTAPTITFDYSPVHWNVDLTSKNTNTLVNWDQYSNQADTLRTDFCYSTNFTLVNENHTPIPSSSPITMNLYNSSDDSSAVTYYSDPMCSSVINSTMIYKSGSSTAPLSATVYFKFNPTGSVTSLKLKAMDTTGAIMGYSKVYNYERVATMLKILGPSTIVASGQCEPLVIMLTDTMVSQNYSPTANVMVGFTGNYASQLYIEPTCTTQANSVMISAGGGGQTMVYLNVNALPTNQPVEFFPYYQSGPYQIGSIGFFSYSVIVQP